MTTNVVALKRQRERYLREAVEAFLNRPSKLAPSTRRVYRQCLSRMVADLGDELPIKDVTLEDLKRHLSDFYLSDDVTAATYNRNVATITSLFTWANRRTWLAASPAIALERRTERRTRQEAQGRVIAPAQLATWIADPAVRLRERLNASLPGAPCEMAGSRTRRRS